MAREIPELSNFTFNSTGITVKVRALGPSTITDIMRFTRRQWQHSSDPSKQEPKPPIVDTPIGKEENRADPRFVQTYRQWEERLRQEGSNRAFEFAAINCVEIDVDYEALEALRQQYAEMGMSEELEPQEHQLTLSKERFDKLLYVTRIVCQSTDDVTRFLQHVTNHSVVSEERIQEHLDSFRDNVSR